MSSDYAIDACKTILWWVKNQTDVNTHLLALNSKPSSFAGASLMATLKQSLSQIIKKVLPVSDQTKSDKNLPVQISIHVTFYRNSTNQNSLIGIPN
jgi:hypothetical protein